MDTRYCPYVGLQGDPDTHTTYPSVRNSCHLARPAEPVGFDEQALHCLTVYSVRCPFYMKRIAAKASLAAPVQPSGQIVRPPLARPLPVKSPDKFPSLHQNPVRPVQKPGAQPVSRLRVSGFIGIGISAVLLISVLAIVWWQSGSQAFSPAASTSPFAGTQAATTDTSAPILPPTTTTFPTAIIAIPALTQPAPTLTDTSLTPIPSAHTVTPAILPASDTPAPLPATPTECTHPARWTAYSVQANDTLYRISTRYGISVIELQNGNCMGTRTIIIVGETLYVPNTPTQAVESQPSDTPSPSETPTLEATLEEVIPTETQEAPTPYP